VRVARVALREERVSTQFWYHQKFLAHGHPAFPRKCVGSAVLQGPPTRHEADGPLLANPEGKTSPESLVSGIKVTASEYTRVRNALAHVGARANSLPRLQKSVFDY